MPIKYAVSNPNTNFVRPTGYTFPTGLNAPPNSTVDYLVVAGAGGGGNGNSNVGGGGGGAGGYKTGTDTLLITGTGANTYKGATILSNGKIKIKKHIYKANDGDNLFMNLIKGEFSEALLDLREVTFTPGGMATQTVIEVIFSETLVVPIVIESLNAAILLNDIDLYFEQGSRDPESGFRILQDILVYMTRGAFKYAGNKFKVWLQSPAGKKKMMEIVSKLSSFVNLIKTSIEKLPNSGLKTYISSKLPKLDLLKNIINKTANLGSLIPKKFRKAIVLGLLTYISAESLDKLLKNKKGTTNLEMSKSDGPSDEFMVDILKVSKPTVSAEEIKTDDDLNIILKKNDLKNITIETIKLWKVEYPCFSGLYEKNKFMVISTTDEMDIFKINGIEYYESGAGIFNSKTNQMFEC